MFLDDSFCEKSCHEFNTSTEDYTSQIFLQFCKPFNMIRQPSFLTGGAPSLSPDCVCNLFIQLSIYVQIVEEPPHHSLLDGLCLFVHKS